MKKKIWLISTIFLVFAAVILYTSIKTIEKSSKEGLVTSQAPNPETDFYLFDNNDYIAIKGGAVVGKRYILSDQLTQKEGEFSVTRKDGSEFYWIVYDMDDNFNSEKYDVYDIVEEYNSDYAYWDAKYILEIDNVEYLLVILKLKQQNTNSSDSVKTVLFKLSDGTISELPSGLSNKFYSSDFDYEDVYGDYWSPFTVTMLNNELDSMLGISFSPNYFGKSSTLQSLPSNSSINLFSEYPDLYDKIYKEDYHVFFRPDRVSPEKYFNDLLHWFAPNGTSSITTYIEGRDGKATATSISSYADYQAWLANGAIR